MHPALLFIVALSFLVLVFFMVKSNRETYNISAWYPVQTILKKTSNLVYVSRFTDLLESISGFVPNTIVNFSFGDFVIQLPVDASGTVKFNKLKTPLNCLPMTAIPYDLVTVVNVNLAGNPLPPPDKPLVKGYNVPVRERPELAKDTVFPVDTVSGTVYMKIQDGAVVSISKN